MNFPGGELALVQKALLTHSWEVIGEHRDAGLGWLRLDKISKAGQTQEACECPAIDAGKFLFVLRVSFADPADDALG